MEYGLPNLVIDRIIHYAIYSQYAFYCETDNKFLRTLSELQGILEVVHVEISNEGIQINDLNDSQIMSISYHCKRSYFDVFKILHQPTIKIRLSLSLLSRVLRLFSLKDKYKLSLDKKHHRIDITNDVIYSSIQLLENNGNEFELDAIECTELFEACPKNLYNTLKCLTANQIEIQSYDTTCEVRINDNDDIIRTKTVFEKSVDKNNNSPFQGRYDYSMFKKICLYCCHCGLPRSLIKIGYFKNVLIVKGKLEDDIDIKFMLSPLA